MLSAQRVKRKCTSLNYVKRYMLIRKVLWRNPHAPTVVTTNSNAFIAVGVENPAHRREQRVVGDVHCSPASVCLIVDWEAKAWLDPSTLMHSQPTWSRWFVPITLRSHNLKSVIMKVDLVRRPSHRMWLLRTIQVLRKALLGYRAFFPIQ